MVTNNIRDILDKYLAGTASAAEQVLVENLLEQLHFPDNSWKSMTDKERSVWLKQLHEDLLKKIAERPASLEESPVALSRHRRLFFYLAAASITALIFIGGWYFISRKPGAKDLFATSKQLPLTDALPGTNKAALILDNGETIILDDQNNGIITSKGNTQVDKKDGQLIYSHKNISGEDQANVYHTLTTPRGGQYSVILPDGSRVWLNAASSIRYPVRFTGNTRPVEIKGEVYFEVAHQKASPFIVHVLSATGTRESSVEVLGTHFNINAYDEESSINTTLLEGKVKLFGSGNADKQVVLAPGQQARVRSDGDIKVVSDLNIEDVVSWKSGIFLMNSVEIPVVLRQLSRWYDVDIVYEGKAPEGRISGDIPMQMKLSEVLKVLELSGLNFKAEEGKIIVKSKN